ncbi:MAG: hypothetical protein SGI74_13430 [Oligoflexia bacterium]|nr:hypothetical protein [Oligoflexia bacterium]
MRLAIIIAFFACTVQGAQNYTQTARESFLNQSLEAFSKATLKNTQDLLAVLDFNEKQKCRSFFGSTTLKCLQKVAESYCQTGTPDCRLIWDLAATNKINENSFTTREERFHISENTDNYPVALAKALRLKYAQLTTRFLLATKKTCNENDNSCLAQQINQYCTKNADNLRLPWQACTSAIIWYRGISAAK